MKRLMILLPMMLSGCNSQPGVSMSNVSASEVANKVVAANAGEAFLSPGHWQGTVKIAHFDMPGAPPQMAAHMAQAIAKDRPIESCLTPEEAKRPKGAFFGGDDTNCRYDHFTMAGGVIDAVMLCQHPDGVKQTMTMKGKYSPDSYQMAMTMKSEGGAGPSANMSMAMNVMAARTGACTGTEKD